MSFASPWLLLFLLAVPLAFGGYFVLERRRAQQARAWSSSSLLPNMVPGRPGRRRYIPLALFLIGLTLLLAGFARPEANVNVAKEGATVVLALDISGSMDAKDVQPTRLLAARAAAVQFLKDLPPKYRVAIVTFSNHSAVRVPPTYDHAQAALALPTKAQAQGTALGDGIAAAVVVAQRAIGKPQPGVAQSPAAVLLLSDGSQSEGRTDPAAAAAQAAKLFIPISTVSLGTDRGVVIQKIPGGTEQIRVPPSPNTLKQVAALTHGGFYEAASAEQLKTVYKDLSSRLVKERKHREITVLATGAAVVFLLAGAVLSGLWFRRLV